MTNFKVLSSLEKVFPDSKLPKTDFSHISVLKNERFAFQIAYLREDFDNSYENSFFKVTVKSSLKKYIKIRRIKYVGAEQTHYKGDEKSTSDFQLSDDDYLRKRPGLYPDVLCELEHSEVDASNICNAIWISVDTKGEVTAGKYDINIVFESKNQKEVKKFTVEIINASLPEQDFCVTQWFHCDCIADIYGVKVFSKKHWDLIKSFAKTAVYNGINTILTPIFTPPLDTRIGGERPTVQLVDVSVNNGQYSFNFEKFHKWVDIMDECGVKYLEISHLFTQWGALAAPKIVAKVDGKTKRIFGWETPGTGKEYSEFLNAFLPCFVNELKSMGIEKRCFFHVSDEPHGDEQLKTYSAAKNIISKHLDGFKIIDALSSIDFYNKGVVSNPIPCTDKIEPFLEAGIKDLWTYYCCAQGYKVSNRFLDMPSYRNRIIGLQFFKYNIAGFLQWGYNFYYTRYSARLINPYTETDGGNAFPAGDAFSVYPGKKGALESIRLTVFYDALQDLRALKLLESYVGHEKAVEFVEDFFSMEIKFDAYPKGAANLLKFRETLNKKIKEIV